MQLEINGHVIETEDYVKKWTDWALDATPLTDEEVTRSIQRLYELAGLPQPKNVVVFREWEEFEKHDWASVREIVREIVRENVWMSVGKSVGVSVGENVWVSVGESVWESVGENVWASVGASVGDRVRESVWESVGESVWENVGVSVRASVGAWHWADDLACADVFCDAGVLSQEKKDELQEYQRILSATRIGLLFQEEAYVLVAPTVRRNSSGQLHDERSPAVQWGKSGLHYLNGVHFPKELWERVVSCTMPFHEILAIEDVDQRAQATRFGNVWEFLKHVHAVELDTHQKIGKNDGRIIRYWLYKIPANGEMYQEDAYLAIYDDSMLGAAKQHMSRVPECKTVAEAMSWKQSITPDQWLELELDVHFT